MLGAAKMMKTTGESGFSLVGIVVVMMALMMIAGVMSTVFHEEVAISTQNLCKIKADYLAETAREVILRRALNENWGRMREEPNFTKYVTDFTIDFGTDMGVMSVVCKFPQTALAGVLPTGATGPISVHWAGELDLDSTGTNYIRIDGEFIACNLSGCTGEQINILQRGLNYEQVYAAANDVSHEEGSQVFRAVLLKTSNYSNTRNLQLKPGTFNLLNRWPRSGMALLGTELVFYCDILNGDLLAHCERGHRNTTINWGAAENDLVTMANPQVEFEVTATASSGAYYGINRVKMTFENEI